MPVLEETGADRSRVLAGLRLRAFDAVTEGRRPKMERRMSRDLVSLFRVFGRQFAIEISPFLEVMRREALELARERPRIGSRAYRNAVRDAVAEYVDPVLAGMPVAEYRASAVSILSDYSLWFYTFGAVTALELLGFSVRGVYPKIGPVRLVEVEKAAAGAGDVVFDLTDPEIHYAMHGRAIEHGAGITNGVIQDARGTVERKVFYGTGDVSTVAPEIASGASIPEWRGLKIARTEAGQSYNTAMNDVFRRSGVLTQYWFTVGDSRVRPEHTENELAGPVPLGTPFPSGQMHPGDGVLSINCRCSVLPDVTDPDLIFEPWDGEAYLEVTGGRLPSSGVLRRPVLPEIPAPRTVVTEVNRPAIEPPPKPPVVGKLPATVAELDELVVALEKAAVDWSSDVAYASKVKRRIYSVATKKTKLVARIKKGALEEVSSSQRKVTAYFEQAKSGGVYRPDYADELAMELQWAKKAAKEAGATADEIMLALTRGTSMGKAAVPEVVTAAAEVTVEQKVAAEVVSWSSKPGVSAEVLDAAELSKIPGWEVVAGGKSQSYGVVIFDEQGRVLLREPSGHFGGAHWTFAKGGGTAPGSTALRELAEETGHLGEIHGIVPGGFEGTTTKTNYFIGRSIGYDSTLLDAETSAVRWMTYDEAVAAIKMSESEVVVARDLKVLREAYATAAGGKSAAFEALVGSAVEAEAAEAVVTSEADRLLQEFLQVSAKSKQLQELGWLTTESRLDRVMDDLLQRSNELFDKLTGMGYSADRLESLATAAGKLVGDRLGGTSEAVAESYRKITLSRELLRQAGISPESMVPKGSDVADVSAYITEYRTAATHYYAIQEAGPGSFADMEAWQVAKRDAWNAMQNATAQALKADVDFALITAAKDAVIAGASESAKALVAEMSAASDALASLPLKGSMPRSLANIDKQIESLRAAISRARAVHAAPDLVSAAEGRVSSLLNKRSLLSRAADAEASASKAALVGDGKDLTVALRQLEEIDKELVRLLPEEAISAAERSTLQEMMTVGVQGPLPATFGELEYHAIALGRQWEIASPSYRAAINHRLSMIRARLAYGRGLPYSPIRGIAPNVGEPIRDVAAWLRLSPGEVESLTDSQVSKGIKFLQTKTAQQMAGSSEARCRMKGLLDNLTQLQESRKRPVMLSKPSPVSVSVTPLKPPYSVAEGALPSERDLARLQVRTNLGGSTGARLVEAPDGRLYVMKTGGSEAHLLEEVIADDLYRACGVAVPDGGVVGELGAGGAKFSVYERGAQSLDRVLAVGGDDAAAAVATLREGFAADCLLGNWDVIGLGADNVLVKSGRVLRIDNGGALRFRAMGAPKGPAWGRAVRELETMRDPAVNPMTARVFGGLSDDDVARQIRALSARKGEIFARARAYDTELEAVLRKRVAFMEEWADNVLAGEKRVVSDATEVVVQPVTGKRITSAEFERGVTDDEVVRIKNSGANGYVRPTDGEGIEDHEIRLWRELDKNGSPRMGAVMKLRGEVAAGLDAEVLGLEMERAVFVARFERWADSMELLSKELMDLKKAGGRLSETQVIVIKRAVREFESFMGEAGRLSGRRVSEAMGEWFTNFRSVADYSTPGGPVSYNFHGLGKRPINIHGESSVRGVRSGRWRWTRQTEWESKGAADGEIRGTGALMDKAAYEKEFNFLSCYETEIDGVTVRYFPGQVGKGAAMQRTLMLTVNGEEIKDANLIMSVLRKLGVDTSRPTQQEAELRYLHQIYRARRLSLPEKLPDGIEDRVAVMARKLSEDCGYDVRKSPRWNPWGVDEVGGAGRRVFYRPDLDNSAMNASVKKHRLVHTVTLHGGIDRSESRTAMTVFRYVVDDGGVQPAKADWLRRGKNPFAAGASPQADMDGGGSAYVYARVHGVQTKHVGFSWGDDVLRRTDLRTHATDPCGDLMEDITLRNLRHGNIKEEIGGAYETMSKGGLSLAEGDFRLTLYDQRDVDEIIAWLKSKGEPFSNGLWYDGRPLEEVIVPVRWD